MSTTMLANRWKSFPCEKKRLNKLVIHVIFETGDLPSLELTVRPLQNGGRETAVSFWGLPLFSGAICWFQACVVTLTFTKRL